MLKMISMRSRCSLVSSGGCSGVEQVQVGVVERDLQEVLVVVREKLIDLFFLVVALLLLLVEEDEDRGGEADRRDDVAQQLPRADVHASAPQKRRARSSPSAPAQFPTFRA